MSITLDGTNGITTPDLAVDTNTLFVDAASNNVGIGTSSPAFTSGDGLEISRSGTATLRVERTGATASAAELFAGNDQVVLQSLTATAPIIFRNGGDPATERARIDASGNLLVGTTNSNPVANSVDGVQFGDGRIRASKSDRTILELQRRTTDGAIAEFRKDGTTVGSIGTAVGYPYVASASRGLHFGHSGSGSQIVPCNGSGADLDNTIDLGAISVRFDDIYATNGTIQTSDRNEKQDIEALSDAEQRVAVAAKGLLRKYRWKDAVAEKGDAARIHFGIIAQDLQAAFAAEGLDAERYGMFISSTWWEAQVERTREVEQEDGTTVTETYTETETYEEPTEGATERTRMGIRYPELLAFIIAAL
jgi:hypothetical protein